ncbi:DUF1697 domain-containing protein [Desulfosporosinus youngiae]|uniref:DUF1697 domain-containing protein n=1 Tax=Desulfosporosinus youngiae DSM 17734 TaxID=768710 RepID=H5XW85_9FIRM|nr:DUF1697 domain-containing protein [Desulfosporosinus youngiae]EHQ90678.1 hypothetical protein DesyoDRAFT_3684 [Desulfosporosinus youngiae DSM 17734]
MKKYIALLRGINVGGNNKISMQQLKETFRQAGYTDAQTYINSGNIIFSSNDSEEALQRVCETLISEQFGLAIAVAIISAEELTDALEHAPEWWNIPNGAKHNAIFVIQPATAEDVCAEVGEIKPEYERVAYYGRVIFWSAPMETFSRTRWSKVSGTKTYQKITVRNANTASKLAELAAAAQ